MGKIYSDFIKRNELSNFREVINTNLTGGAMITKISKHPDIVFEVLEILCGDYFDPYASFLHVDNKSMWERQFESKSGILTIYDYKRSVSLGYIGEINEELKNEATVLRDLIEKACDDFANSKAQIINESIIENPLRNFTLTFPAVVELISKAEESNSLLEMLVLKFAMVDAQLRFALILKTQIDNESEEIERKLIIQEDKKDYYTEKKYSRWR